MRKSAWILALLLASVASAQVRTPQPDDLFLPATSTNRIVIPVAGETAGANGTYFRSDISIINFRDVAQRVELRWLPADGTSGEDVPAVTIQINARSGVSAENFVSSVMGRTGLGAIEVIGVTEAGGVDADARLHAAARIWTPEPAVANGTMSQTFPAVIHTSAAGPLRWIFGVRRNEQYRLNVGITNLSSSSQRFRITAVGNGQADDPVEFTMPARSMRQVNLTGAATGTFQIVVQNVSPSPSASFEAWASSIDNVTGDAWSQIAFPAPAQ